MIKGFTLIETLVVVVIISVALSVGVSGFWAYRDQFEVSGEINELVSDLRYAKQMSIAEQIHHGIRFDFSNNSYKVIRYEDNEVIRENIFPPGVELHAVDDYDEARFTRFGAVFKSGEVMVKGHDFSRLIKIKPSGFFHVERIDFN